MVIAEWQNPRQLVTSASVCQKQMDFYFSRKENIFEKTISLVAFFVFPRQRERWRRKQLKLQIGDNWKFKYSQQRGNHFINIIMECAPFTNHHFYLQVVVGKRVGSNHHYKNHLPSRRQNDPNDFQIIQLFELEVWPKLKF